MHPGSCADTVNIRWWRRQIGFVGQEPECLRLLKPETQGEDQLHTPHIMVSWRAFKQFAPAKL